MTELFDLITNLTILQAVVFFFLFTLNRKRNVSLILLGIYLITIVGPGLHFLLDNFNIKAVYEFPTNFYLLSPPIFYLYTKSVLGILSKKDIKHLVLGTLEFVFFLYLFIYPYEFATTVYRNFLIPNRVLIFTVFIPIYSVSYLVASILILRKYNFRVEEFYSINEQKRLKWIYVTNIISIFLYILDTITTFISIKYGFQVNVYLIITSAIAFIVFWISIYGLNQKNLILDIDDDKIDNLIKESQIKESEKNEVTNEFDKKSIESKNESNEPESKDISLKKIQKNKIEIDLEKNEKIYDNNLFLALEFQSNYQKIVLFLEETKIYKDKEINLFRLAELVQIPYRDVSKAINSIANKNFNQFLNEFRVNEAKRLIKQDELQKYNLSWIAEEVGFNSRSTFFAVFKSLVGMTPNEFKNS
jgi:AraC-like DNA-binding protein